MLDVEKYYMPKSNRTAYTYLGLYGDFEAEIVSRLIPLVPDKCQTKHSKNLDHRLPRTSILRYAEVSASDEVPDIYELANKSLSILTPHKEALIGLSRKHCSEVVFQVVLDFSTDEDISTPAIGFTKELLDFIHSLEASIDIDTYYRS